MSAIRRYGGAVLRRLGFRRPAPASGQAFTDAVCVRYGLQPGDPAPNETVQMWLDFSLSSVERGQPRLSGHSGGGRQPGLLHPASYSLKAASMVSIA